MALDADEAALERPVAAELAELGIVEIALEPAAEVVLAALLAADEADEAAGVDAADEPEAEAPRQAELEDD